MIKEARFKYYLSRYRDNVYGYALHMLGNPMDAEDAAQEVLVKLWENLHNIDRSKVKAWLMSSTRNRCIDRLRKRKSVESSELPFAENFEDFFPAEQNSENPYDNTDRNMFLENLKNKLEKLPDNLKNVFVLYQFHELKYREIATVLEMPVNSVKVYLMRARKQLGEELKEYA